MKRHITRIVLIMVLVCGAALIYGYRKEPTELEKKIPTLAQETKEGHLGFDININKSIEESHSLTDFDILSVCHRMTHPYVKAPEKWYGTFPTDKKSIKNLMIKIEQNNELERNVKDDLLSFLGEYYEGDFTNSVKFHNYVWREENGDTGKATGLTDLAKQGR
ncbi:DUF6241 domain-containing protein [Alloiococcus sp. CFN-8]|uniref:DUF6241 domain-containing protein n=1 Tax=Alloiococcus sp. CFN-8 TaxID=3416081 RepID=UPI003CF2719D